MYEVIFLQSLGVVTNDKKVNKDKVGFMLCEH